MLNQEPLGRITADHITVVTALLSDDGIEVDRVVAEKNPSKHPRFAHCVWYLVSHVYTSEQLTTIERGIRADIDPGGFTYRCPKCELSWVESGNCGPVCGGAMPGFFTFDNAKRTVIDGKRKAQEQLAEDRGFPSLYSK